MKPPSIFVALLLFVSDASTAKSDLLGPSVARQATSPDGELVVRIKSPVDDGKSKERPSHEVTYYAFDSSKDSYTRRFSFKVTGLSQMLLVSNAGDLIMISLGETNAIRLYSKEGKLAKSWNLNDFLSEDEVTACAQTGSTLQWLEEGVFYDRVFHFRGPSRQVRALTPPYTVMRVPDEKVTFSASIDTATAKLVKHKPTEP